MSELSEHPSVAAERKGVDIVLPEGHELFIDADDAASLATLADGLKCLIDNGEAATESKRTVSPGGNTHVYLNWPQPLFADPTTGALLRVALQACLGSDRKRELLALLRIMRGYDIPPTCFFESRTPVLAETPEPGK